MAHARPIACLRALLWDRRAVAATEFALLLPFLLVLLLSSAVFFDYFRHQQALERSVYTVGDILSRQTSIDTDLLAFMRDMVGELVPVSIEQIALRVTSIERTEAETRQLWQRTVGPSWEGLAISNDMIPEIAVGDSVLIVQANMAYQPPFAFGGLTLRAIENAAVYRPRFVSSISFE